MRKVIGTVIAIAMVAAGAYLIFEGFGADVRRIGWTGPMLAIAGSLWIASDWFNL